MRVRVPGSSANLGPGFDSVGLALGVWDSYVVGITEEPGVRVIRPADSPDNPDVPSDERHLVYATMRRTWDLLGVPPPDGGVLMRCGNRVPQGRGVGSSAAAIVAGVALGYALATDPTPAADGSLPLDLTAVNDLASALEGHPDNASASVFGGMTLSWIDDASPWYTTGAPAASDGTAAAVLTEVPRQHRPARPARVHTVRLPLHPEVEPVLLLPVEQLPTSTARAVLPPVIPHRQAAWNSARVGLLVHAVSARPDLLTAATRDWLHQEFRRPALGGALELVDGLRAAGFAAVISGAGPSVLVLTTRDAAEAAVRTAAESAGASWSRWQALRPGVPETGVQTERATFDVLLGESDV